MPISGALLCLFGFWVSLPINTDPLAEPVYYLLDSKAVCLGNHVPFRRTENMSKSLYGESFEHCNLFRST